eukprot:s203_g8.t1
MPMECIVEECLEATASLFRATGTSIALLLQPRWTASSSILPAAEGKSPQSLTPTGFAADLARASRRICLQAGKISRRSVEQAGKLMSLPFRPALGS